MRKKVFYSLIVGVFLVLALSILIAANSNSSQNSSNNSSSGKEHKMTYGLCVANQTRVQNSCFKEAQVEYKKCNLDIKNLTETLKDTNQSLNKTQINDLRKACRDNLKSNLTTCRNEFKQAKVLCIQYRCRDNEAFLNNTCVKMCDKNQAFINGTCVIIKCDHGQTLINNTCVKTCKDNEALINNTCTKMCDSHHIFTNDTCAEKCRGNEVLVNNSCIREH